MEKAITYILNKHRSHDQQEGGSSSMKEHEERDLSHLRLKAQKIKSWLGENEDKIGKGGNIKKSNLTDNESAKMATSHGVIQGYDGVVAAPIPSIRLECMPRPSGKPKSRSCLNPWLKG